jgi:hypothetical protein
MFCVATPRFEARFLNRPVDSSGSLPARSRADVEEEPDQEGGCDDERRGEERAVVVGLQDPEHAEQADRRQDRSHRVERTRRIGR